MIVRFESLSSIRLRAKGKEEEGRGNERVE